MTRCRADLVTRVPTPIMRTYYRQRAGAGLIVTEGTIVSADAAGYPATPGIYSPEQVSAWKDITDAVHAEKGRIFLQLWHCGRVSHSSFIEGKLPISSSAIAPPGEVMTPQGMKSYEIPHELTLEDIPQVIDLYACAAQNALKAGFDGVELYGASGYLIDQFLRDGVNHRRDAYGGTIAKRTRFLIEVTEAVIRVWGKERVGLRLSPNGTFNHMSDSDPKKNFSYIVSAVSDLGLGYLHILEGDPSHAVDVAHTVDCSIFRKLFKGTLILCGGYDEKKARSALVNDRADLVALGKLFIANPDLPERMRHGQDLNSWDEGTFFTGGEKGYVDYFSNSLRT
jgi:N-ethylmaleimide reductase